MMIPSMLVLTNLFNKPIRAGSSLSTMMMLSVKKICPVVIVGQSQDSVQVIEVEVDGPIPGVEFAEPAIYGIRTGGNGRFDGIDISSGSQ